MTTSSLGLSQKSASETDNNPSFERKEVQNTPFAKIYEEDKGWYLVLGRYRVTEPTDSEKKLDAIIKNKPWDMLIAVIGIVQETYLEAQKEATK